DLQLAAESGSANHLRQERLDGIGDSRRSAARWYTAGLLDRWREEWTMSRDPLPMDRMDEQAREQRLFEIRREAEQTGQVKLRGIRPAGAPFPQASPETGYYGIPLLKPPRWTNEIPLYFFVGGASGAAAVIGAIAHYTGADRTLVRDARWIAAAGSVISPALLIADLGRPQRFLAMMRVFKPQSPMSV